MDQIEISRIIKETLEGFNHESLNIFFDKDNVIRIVIISHSFIGVRLLRRLDMLTKLFHKVSSHELIDYHLIFNPLTIHEKEFGSNELHGSSIDSGDPMNGKIATSI
jgi:hypothetical protein